MLKNKQIVWRRRASIFRTAIIITGMGCILHLAHRECARCSDKPLRNNVLSESAIDGSSTAGAPQEFQATAYCLTGITKSGARTILGCVATDPEIIPLGSMIYVDSPLMGGIYQVLDTGGLIKGKIIDIFIPHHGMCREFGRRTVKVKVLRYGFLGNPPTKSDGE